MSYIQADSQGAVHVRFADAETLGEGPIKMTLYADYETTGGAVSANRATMAAGRDGAAPHFHTKSSELFFVVEGSLQVLAGDDVITANKGDFLVVPPKMPHAFAAPEGSPADVLIVFTPGLERFDYFRLLDRVAHGQADPQEILDSQERFDNHFLDSPAWRAARSA
ncbi:cupin domain-containing protein [Fodinicola feengrottensis]|uniref:Cupin domain-containing protein n=1 Tax=Fodinicola feengrottensis TaxID=435914 RepID=A0ABP4TGQ0_9ACTN